MNAKQAPLSRIVREFFNTNNGIDSTKLSMPLFLHTVADEKNKG